MTGGRSWGQATVAELSILGIDTSEKGDQKKETIWPSYLMPQKLQLNY